MAIEPYFSTPQGSPATLKTICPFRGQSPGWSGPNHIYGTAHEGAQLSLDGAAPAVPRVAERENFMRTMQRRATTGAALGLMAMMALTLPAAAAAGSSVQADLLPVAGNGVAGSGTAMVTIDGTTLTVDMAATGLLADAPHAAHIHFGATARHECPSLSDDTDGDGHLTTTEGGPAYGEIVVSLTKTGDTSPKSALAVDRFDTAPGGSLSYQRGSIQVTDAVAANVQSGKAVVVIHGVDYNNDGKYSGDKKSELDPSLPTEATDPALCGVLAVSQMSGMPTGGVDTGGGSTAGAENVGLITAGGLALLGGVVLIARRRTSPTER